MLMTCNFASMSIEVKEITKLYGEQRALNEVSFSIEKGSVVGFLGPNGAGKSTMMKILTCFIPQSSGTASVAGFDVEEYPMEVKKRVGYLPEHNPLYLDMYVAEYLQFIAGVHKLPKRKEKAAEMIERVGLTLERKKKIGALSKGYRQRVGLAQAMIHDPEVLILDEPTSGLDPNQIVEIRDLIQNFGENRTVMLSTHIMQEVEAICDRVIIINRGKLVADESAASLKQFQDKQVVRVEFSDEVSKSQLMRIAGISSAEKDKGNSWLLSGSSESDLRKLVFDFAVNEKLSVLTIQNQEQKLEDIFKQLTIGTE